MTVSTDIRPASWHGAIHADAAVSARDGVIDTMRGLAVLMVIGIHALPKAESSALVTAIDAVLRPCVPIFLFASGYLTMQSGQVPLTKRIRRTLEPYTIAFIAAYAFMAADNPAMDHRPVAIVARYGLAYVFVYYYVFVYIGCTLMLWALMTFAGRGATQRLNVLLGLAILFGLAVGAYLDPLLQRWGVVDTLIEEVRLRDLPFWFAFVAAGGLVGGLKLQPALRGMRHSLVGTALAAYLVYAAVRITGLGDAADYDSIAFFLYASLMCVTLLAFARDSAALSMLGSASYFIYLWHIFIIMALRPLPLLQQHRLAATVIEYAAALSVSVLLVWALRRLMPPRVAQALGV